MFMLAVVIDHSGMDWSHPGFNFINTGTLGDLPFLSTVYVKLGFLMIMAFGYKQILHEYYSEQSRLKSLSPAVLFFGSKTTRLRQLVSCLIIALLTLNFLLIAIVNPSLLNPGPQNLSVYYQNVQGLIPFSNLRDTHPILNRTKILELNT